MKKYSISDIMLENQKFIKWVLLAIMLGSVILFTVISIYYHNDVDLMNISKYSAVICNHDKKLFLSDTCEGCGESIFVSGKLYNIETQEFDNFVDIFGYKDKAFENYSLLMIQWDKLSKWLNGSILVGIMALLSFVAFSIYCPIAKMRGKFKKVNKLPVDKIKAEIIEDVSTENKKEEVKN